jgi:hypothetical protein
MMISFSLHLLSSLTDKTRGCLLELPARHHLLTPSANWAKQKAGLPKYIFDISAARLSRRDPEGFPPHPRRWLSIVVYLMLRKRTAENGLYPGIDGPDRYIFLTVGIKTIREPALGS